MYVSTRISPLESRDVNIVSDGDGNDNIGKFYLEK
jgi:hypothetical protein